MEFVTTNVGAIALESWLILLLELYFRSCDKIECNAKDWANRMQQNLKMWKTEWKKRIIRYKIIIIMYQFIYIYIYIYIYMDYKNKIVKIANLLVSAQLVCCSEYIMP